MMNSFATFYLILSFIFVNLFNVVNAQIGHFLLQTEFFVVLLWNKSKNAPENISMCDVNAQRINCM